METTVTRPKHPGRVAQGHKLAALMKSRKEDLSKEQAPVQSTVQSSVVKSVQAPVQSTVQAPVQYSTVQHSLKPTSYEFYMYGVGTLSILAVGCLVWYSSRKQSSSPPEPEKQLPKQQQQKTYKPML